MSNANKENHEIYGQVVEIKPQFVVVDCALNVDEARFDEPEFPDNPVFEEREFPDYLFTWGVEIGDYVTFEIRWEPGKQTILARETEDPDEDLFEISPDLDAVGEPFSESVRV